MEIVKEICYNKSEINDFIAKEKDLKMCIHCPPRANIHHLLHVLLDHAHEAVTEDDFETVGKIHAEFDAVLYEYITSVLTRNRANQIDNEQARQTAH